MLQQIRDKITGWFAIVFLGAIAIVFIFWGIQFESSVNLAAAKVNGEKIPLEEVRRAWQERQTELQQAARDELAPEVVKTEQQRIVDEYVGRALLLQRADELGYRVSDRELVQALHSIPALQVDGQFSRDRYAAALRQQGRNEAAFEQEFRRDLAIAQLRNAMAVSSFVLPAELERRAALEGESRDVDFVVVPAERFAASATPTAEQVEAWYQANPADFRTPERVSLQYVELGLADVASSVEVTDEALRKFYDQVAAERYVSTERRRARHILVESGADDAAARAEAEKLTERARGGEQFAELAAANSDDPGSKGQGGDLGWATRESFVGPFADALFGMQKGEIRGPVKTQFGYHVILLEDVEPGHQRTFDEVRSELEQDYRQDQAQSLFYERSQQLADEAFTNLDSLESVATQLGLPLRTVDGFTREGGGPFAAERKIIDAVFSPEVLEERQNSPAVQVGEDRVVVLRVTDHQLPAQRTLDEARAEVEAKLRAGAASKAAVAAAQAAAEQVNQGAAWAKVSTGLGLPATGVRTVARNGQELPPDIAKAIFTAPAPPEGKTTAGSTVLPNGDALLFAVSAARPGTVAAAEQAALRQQAAGRIALAEFGAYVGELERTAKVVRNPKVFE
jgi:peptidyl-prolyl cis-trans isomerase D